MEQLVGATVQLDNHDCRAINTLSQEYREVELKKRTTYSRAGLKAQEDHLQSLSAQEAKWLQRKQQAEARLRVVSMEKHAMLGVVGYSLSKKQAKAECDRMVAMVRSRQDDLRRQEQLIRKNYLQRSDCYIQPGPGRPPAIGAQQPAYLDYNTVPNVEEIGDFDDDLFDQELMKFDQERTKALPSSEDNNNYKRLPGPGGNW